MLKRRLEGSAFEGRSFIGWEKAAQAGHVDALNLLKAKEPIGGRPISYRSLDRMSECVVLERFRDSEALIEHAENLGDLVEAILATVSVVHGELLGEPSAELRAKLAGSEFPHLFTPYQSM